MFSVLRKKKKQELTFYLKIDENWPNQSISKPHTSHQKCTTRLSKRSCGKMKSEDVKKQQEKKEPQCEEKLKKQSTRKGANLSNIKKLTKLYNIRTQQNKQKFQEISQDYLVNRVKIVGIFRSGNFGNVYRAIMNNINNCLEVAVKKVQIDTNHISREEYFAKNLKSSYVVQFIGTYYTVQNEQIREDNQQNSCLKDININKTNRNGVDQPSCQKRYLNIVMKKYGNNLSEILQLQSIQNQRMKILLYQMFRSIMYIHGLNICHRDIKPHNFVLKSNRILLCDFGASKIMNQKQKSVSYIFSREYRAPELLFNFDNYDKSVDIWALGCVIAEMILRKPLFKGSNNLDQLIKILKVLGSPKWELISFSRNKTPKIPEVKGIGLESIFDRKCDPLLISLLQKMLRIEPKQRISAIEALCDPYFDEIRDQSFYRTYLRGTNLPNFFYFTKSNITITQNNLLENNNIQISQFPFGQKNTAKDSKYAQGIIIFDFTKCLIQKLQYLSLQIMDGYVEILGCNGTAIYQIDNHNINFYTSGRLEVLIAYDGLIMFKLNDFQHRINPNQQIICDRNDPQFQIVLQFNKYSSGKWIIKINEHADQVFSCLDQKCYLKLKPAAQNYTSQRSTGQVQQKKEKKKKNYEQLENESNVQQKPEKMKAKQSQKEQQPGDLQIEQKNNKITASSIIVGASKGLGWGLKFTGKILSKGFEAVGGLASKAVKPVEKKVEVSQKTKANIDLAKKTSKSVLGFAATQVGNIVQFGKQTATNIGQRFEKSDKGKQMQENPKYEQIKEGTKTGVQVFANIYEGVVGAVYEIGSGISKGTSKVVGKKYGEQAGEATDQIFEGVGNVVKITRVPQDQLAKSLK